MSKHDLTQFHSCFVIDVEVDKTDNVVRLADSSRMKYTYRLDNEGKAEEFKRWLKSVFLAGKAQTLSVFKYHEEGQDHEIELVIDKFIGDFQKPQMISEFGPSGETV